MGEMTTLDDRVAALRAHRSGLLFDLAVAVGWVTVVPVVFDVLGAPPWAASLAMVARVVASLEAVRDVQ
ncbi:hypothetical protein ACKVMT_11670 [Halobacteriales archaeon Cl-PHB]